MSEEIIENITKSDRNFAQTFLDHHSLPGMNFNGHCLIKSNIYIPKKSNKSIFFLHTNSEIKKFKHRLCINCLFGSVKLSKNADLDKYEYTGYNIGFDSCSEFSFTDGSFGKIVIFFGTYTNSSVHIGNKVKDILILGERSLQGSDPTTLTAGANILQKILQNQEKELH